MQHKKQSFWHLFIWGQVALLVVLSYCLNVNHVPNEIQNYREVAQEGGKTFAPPSCDPHEIWQWNGGSFSELKKIESSVSAEPSIVLKELVITAPRTKGTTDFEPLNTDSGAGSSNLLEQQWKIKNYLRSEFSMGCLDDLIPKIHEVLASWESLNENLKDVDYIKSQAEYMVNLMLQARFHLTNYSVRKLPDETLVTANPGAFDRDDAKFFAFAAVYHRSLVMLYKAYAYYFHSYINGPKPLSVITADETFEGYQGLDRLALVMEKKYAFAFNNNTPVKMKSVNYNQLKERGRLEGKEDILYPLLERLPGHPNGVGSMVALNLPEDTKQNLELLALERWLKVKIDGVNKGNGDPNHLQYYYKRLLHFLALRESIINTWAVNRYVSDDTAPSDEEIVSKGLAGLWENTVDYFKEAVGVGSSRFHDVKLSGGVDNYLSFHQAIGFSTEKTVLGTSYYKELERTDYYESFLNPFINKIAAKLVDELEGNDVKDSIRNISVIEKSNFIRAMWDIYNLPEIKGYYIRNPESEKLVDEEKFALRWGNENVGLPFLGLQAQYTNDSEKHYPEFLEFKNKKIKDLIINISSAVLENDSANWTRAFDQVIAILYNAIHDSLFEVAMELAIPPIKGMSLESNDHLTLQEGVGKIIDLYIDKGLRQSIENKVIKLIAGLILEEYSSQTWVARIPYAPRSDTFTQSIKSNLGSFLASNSEEERQKRKVDLFNSFDVFSRKIQAAIALEDKRKTFLTALIEDEAPKAAKFLNWMRMSSSILPEGAEGQKSLRELQEEYQSTALADKSGSLPWEESATPSAYTLYFEPRDPAEFVDYLGGLLDQESLFGGKQKGIEALQDLLSAPVESGDGHAFLANFLEDVKKRYRDKFCAKVPSHPSCNVAATQIQSFYKGRAAYQAYQKSGRKIFESQHKFSTSNEVLTSQEKSQILWDSMMEWIQEFLKRPRGGAYLHGTSWKYAELIKSGSFENSCATSVDWKRTYEAKPFFMSTSVLQSEQDADIKKIFSLLEEHFSSLESTYQWDIPFVKNVNTAEFRASAGANLDAINQYYVSELFAHSKIAPKISPYAKCVDGGHVLSFLLDALNLKFVSKKDQDKPQYVNCRWVELNTEGEYPRRDGISKTLCLPMNRSFQTDKIMPNLRLAGGRENDLKAAFPILNFTLPYTTTVSKKYTNSYRNTESSYNKELKLAPDFFSSLSAFSIPYSLNVAVDSMCQKNSDPKFRDICELNQVVAGTVSKGSGDLKCPTIVDLYSETKVKEFVRDVEDYSSCTYSLRVGGDSGKESSLIKMTPGNFYEFMVSRVRQSISEGSLKNLDGKSSKPTEDLFYLRSQILANFVGMKDKGVRAAIFEADKSLVREIHPFHALWEDVIVPVAFVLSLVSLGFFISSFASVHIMGLGLSIWTPALTLLTTSIDFGAMTVFSANWLGNQLLYKPYIEFPKQMQMASRVSYVRLENANNEIGVGMDFNFHQNSTANLMNRVRGAEVNNARDSLIWAPLYLTGMSFMPYQLKSINYLSQIKNVPPDFYLRFRNGYFVNHFYKRSNFVKSGGKIKVVGFGNSETFKIPYSAGEMEVALGKKPPAINNFENSAPKGERLPLYEAPAVDLPLSINSRFKLKATGLRNYWSRKINKFCKGCKLKEFQPSRYYVDEQGFVVDVEFIPIQFDDVFEETYLINNQVRHKKRYKMFGNKIGEWVLNKEGQEESFGGVLVLTTSKSHDKAWWRLYNIHRKFDGSISLPKTLPPDPVESIFYEFRGNQNAAHSAIESLSKSPPSSTGYFREKYVFKDYYFFEQENGAKVFKVKREWWSPDRSEKLKVEVMSLDLGNTKAAELVRENGYSYWSRAQPAFTVEEGSAGGTHVTSKVKRAYQPVIEPYSNKLDLKVQPTTLELRPLPVKREGSAAKGSFKDSKGALTFRKGEFAKYSFEKNYSDFGKLKGEEPQLIIQNLDKEGNVSIFYRKQGSDGSYIPVNLQEVEVLKNGTVETRQYVISKNSLTSEGNSAKEFVVGNQTVRLKTSKYENVHSNDSLKLEGVQIEYKIPDGSLEGFIKVETFDSKGRPLTAKLRWDKVAGDGSVQMSYYNFELAASGEIINPKSAGRAPLYVDYMVPVQEGKKPLVRNYFGSSQEPSADVLELKPLTEEQKPLQLRPVEKL